MLITSPLNGFNVMADHVHYITISIIGLTLNHLQMI